MSVAAGVDLVDLGAFARLLAQRGEALLKEVFTPGELADSGTRMDALAVRFAAKEAAAKALGTGIGPVGWQEIEIRTEPSGRPVLVLHGEAARHARRTHLSTWSVSLSHAGQSAIAFVVASSDRTAHRARTTFEEAS